MLVIFVLKVLPGLFHRVNRAAENVLLLQQVAVTQKFNNIDQEVMVIVVSFR